MTGKNCLVTGGARGIGRATALLAAQAGWHVSVAGLPEHMGDASEVVSAIERAGGKAIALPVDVREEDAIVAMFERSEEQLGPLGAVVNAAGMLHFGAVADFDFEEIVGLMRVNVVGVMICCREAARRMSTARGGQGGSIVNISSLAATIGGRPGASAYAASKAAIDVFTTGFAREAARQGIRVNTIRPGAIATAMTANLAADPELRRKVEESIPLGRLGQPEEIGELAVWLLSDRASLVTGAHINAGGGGFNVQAAA